MYGLVNHGVQTFITNNFGQEDWQDICRRADVHEQDFATMLTYADDVTYRLVGAIGDKYAMDTSEVLRTFGDFWIDYASDTTIGQLLRFSGQSLIERLEALDDMHERIKLSMPHLEPPSFEFEVGDSGVHKLHYASHRDGLEHMVIGLVQGLARETGEQVQISQDPEPAYEGLRATFTLCLG